MKSIFLTTALLLSVTFFSEAQVPGFMGKRASFSLNLNPTPALINQNENNVIIFNIDENSRSTKQNYLAFNYRPQVSFDYLVGKNLSLGIDYKLLTTGTTRAYEEEPEKENDYEHLHNDDVLKGSSLGLHIKYFLHKKSGSIAPIGYYQTLGLEYATLNTYDDKDSDEKLFVNDFKHFILTYEAGKQNVFFNTLLISYGVEFGYAFVPGNFMFEEPQWTIQEESGYNVHRSLFGYYVFSFKLGIGSLLF
ncbi:hypothetical protein [Fulvivirga sediminis]|uniref:Outer membrane protein beta-barrel domain-containing protein n=1 Tax=Fulvivirga sediminis TaxID=2803949 RepID=A0A937K201_9BACT|nr:hypothetical protein [Fulvivirga sediminis]MBL3657865.1 hypothetical protein [Fulvivirga sediminis]